MIKSKGFTLVELIMFILISAILANTVLLALNVSNLKSPTARQQMVATSIARQCMESIIGQRRIAGFNALICGSTAIPYYCNVAPGFSLSLQITCTNILDDPNYKTVTISVTGPGDAGLTTLVAAY